MAVVSEHRLGCDGCGQMVAFKELTPVTMPGGEQVVCCPECEPHARAAAQKGSSLDQRRETCDGCTSTFLTAELEDVVLEDGTILTCCPSCAAEVPDRDDGTADDSTGETMTGESNGTTESERNASGATTESEPDRSEQTTESEPNASEHTTEAEPNISGDGTPAQNRCSQCRERVAAELFRVTTIDDRTERLCPGCKVDAEERGIVADVDMRKTKAREVLGVDADASDEELREAYHNHVKRAHPDRKSGSKSAFKLVTKAYDRLRDAD